MIDSKLLEGKIAFITGGTRGIGFATAKKFLEHGAKVIICGSSEKSSKKAEEELKLINPNYEVFSVWGNLSDRKGASSIAQAALSIYGKCDILVNNAGVSSMESVFNYTDEEFERIMNININSMFFITRKIAESMRDNKDGVILNTSSMMSIYGQPSGCAYPTSKFAVNGLTKSLARELAAYNIRVNAVAPGITETDMLKNLPEETQKNIIKTIPLGRIGSPEDIANAFLFLASDLASYITGVILSVDGCART